jgi:hypothetical protein
VARATAYAWLVIYVAAPVIMLILLIRELRAPGTDPAHDSRLPAALRLAYIVEALILIGGGCVLFVAPALAATAWPWMLTPLTARVVGAWGVGLGIAAGHGAVENTWRRSRLVPIGNTAFGALQLLAVWRFSDELRWNMVVTPMYIATLLAILLIGIYGLLAGRSRRTLGR